MKKQVQYEHQSSTCINGVAAYGLGETIQNWRKTERERNELDQIGQIALNLQQTIVEENLINKLFESKKCYFCKSSSRW